MILSVCANPSVDSFWSIPDITKATTNRSTGESFYPGGKGIHVAMALSELGAAVTALGVWGGPTGRWLQEECQGRNITTLGPEVEGWTRICVTNQTDTPWNETEFLGGGPTLSQQECQQFEEAFRQALADNAIEAVTISGSIPDGFNIGIYKKLVNQCKDADIPTFVDASGLLLEETLHARPHAIHINHHEGQALCSSDSPSDIARWLSEYCTVAAVTAGADGLYLATNNTLWHGSYTIPSSKIYSTVGAGDCLTAGLCLASLRYDSPQEWVKLGTACGSANCIHPKLGMLSANDVTTIAENVTLREVSF